MANKPGYFKDYYNKHGEDLLKKRKQRYQSDPEYRDKVLSASQEYRKGLRSEPRVHTRRYQKPVVGTSASGVEVQLHSVGAMSGVLGRTVQAINHWQKRGLIPDTPYRDARGFRFYTIEMMEAIADEVGEKRRLFPVDPEMSAKIKKKWSDLGVPVDYSGTDIQEAISLTRPFG